MPKLQVRWVIDDGFAGRRAKTTIVNTDHAYTEEEWESLSDLEKESFIYEMVQEDFQERVSFFIDSTTVL